VTASQDHGAGGGVPVRKLSRLIVARPFEVPAVIGGFLLFFLLFTSYFMLRPVRETFGIAGGVDNLQWLFTGTFVVTLVVVPLYGWVTSRMPRRRLLPILYSASAAVMAGFAISLAVDPQNIWVARAFYIWLSVFNLFVISVAWSLMADLFERDQAHRLFGQMAAGSSLGGLAGPVISGVLVGPLGEAGLLFLSTGILVLTLVCVRYLIGWRDRVGPKADENREAPAPDRIGGSIWAGLTLILRSRYLLVIAGFVLLLTTASTFLYFEQARIVEATFPDRTRQTQAFASIDAAVQSITILIQILFTGRLAKRLGVTALLVAVPVTMMFGFGLLAFAATFPVLVFVMMVRRIGEYALVRPGREMLFAAVDIETKYKAKNAIDTMVYRGGDAVAGWLYTGIVALLSTGAVAIAGAILAGLWGAVGLAIGRRHDRGTGSRPAI
jgi:AAA family ATP:ADP antiporter